MTIAEAARTLAEVVARAERGEGVGLTRNGRLVVRIVPFGSPLPCKTGAELARWWSHPARPRPTSAEAEAFEADLDSARETLPFPRKDPWE